MISDFDAELNALEQELQTKDDDEIDKELSMKKPVAKKVPEDEESNNKESPTKEEKKSPKKEVKKEEKLAVKEEGDKKDKDRSKSRSRSSKRKRKRRRSRSRDRRATRKSSRSRDRSRRDRGRRERGRTRRTRKGSRSRSRDKKKTSSSSTKKKGRSPSRSKSKPQEKAPTPPPPKKKKSRSRSKSKSKNEKKSSRSKSTEADDSKVAVKKSSRSKSKEKSKATTKKSSRSKSKEKSKAAKKSSRSKSKEKKSKRSKSKSRDRRRRSRRSRDRGRSRRSRDRGRSRRSRDRGRTRKRKRSPEADTKPRKTTRTKKEEHKKVPRTKKEEPKNVKKEVPQLTEEQKAENKRQLLEAQIKAASESINAQITRPARKLYVGNLPTDLGLTEKMLVQFFTACLSGLGVRTQLPIMSAWINGDQTFAFIEFRSVQDATLALTLYDGLSLGGRQLRFGRPVDYKLPERHLLCYLVGGIEPVGDLDVPYTMPQVEENSPAWHLATALMNQRIGETGSDPSASMVIPKSAPKSYKSRVIMLEECVSEAMIMKDEDYIDVIEDIKEECDQWGKLLQLVIPRRGQDPCGFNRVFLRYEKQSGADRCLTKTDGREFGEGTVKVHYFDEKMFTVGEWDAHPMKTKEEDEEVDPKNRPKSLADHVGDINDNIGNLTGIKYIK